MFNIRLNIEKAMLCRVALRFFYFSDRGDISVMHFLFGDIQDEKFDRIRNDAGA